MSRIIRWGVLGASSIAQEKFIPAVAATPGTAVCAIASRERSRAVRLTEVANAPRAYDSYTELLDDPDLDAIYISVPNTLHAEWVIAALKAGKAVLCEKPMVLDAEEAELVAAASAQTKRPVLEGFMYRFHPQNAFVRRRIKEGAIGEVREVAVHFSFPLVGRMESTNIRVTDGKGAGALMDVGSYVVSAARMLFGTEPQAATGWMDVDHDLGIDVGYSGSLMFPDARFATISWSLRGGYGAGYRVVGSTGCLDVPNAFLPGSAGMEKETTVTSYDSASVAATTRFAPTDQFAQMVHTFSDALRSGAEMPYGAPDALANARALDLVREGARPELPASAGSKVVAAR